MFLLLYLISIIHFFIAPGDYCPEKAITALDSTPKYTFGFKTNVEKPFETPGICLYLFYNYFPDKAKNI